MAKRCANLSKEQKDNLFEILKNEHKLTSGKFSSNFTAKDAQQKWQNLAEILNAIPGAKKDWKQWRKVWQDTKQKVKSKKSEILQHRKKTGGGKPTPDLSHAEENVLSLISETSIAGLPVEESIISMDIDDENSGPMETGDENIYLPTPTVDDIEAKPSTSNFNKETSSKARTKKSSGIRNLENSIRATELLANTAERKLKIKESYYEQKLALLRRDIEVKEELNDNLKNLLQKVDILISKYSA